MGSAIVCCSSVVVTRIDTIGKYPASKEVAVERLSLLNHKIVVKRHCEFKSR